MKCLAEYTTLDRLDKSLNKDKLYLAYGHMIQSQLKNVYIFRFFIENERPTISIIKQFIVTRKEDGIQVVNRKRAYPHRYWGQTKLNTILELSEEEMNFLIVSEI